MKLIDLLVQELPKRGGWPEGSAEAEVFTYEGGLVNFWTEEGKPFNGGADNFRLKGLELCEVESVTRAKYESALAASEGWIEWGGWECPVAGNALVEVRFRDGTIMDAYRADGYIWTYGFLKEKTCDSDIVAYRPYHPHKQDSVTTQHGVWNGEGLPPVGTICMANLANGWTDVKVAYIGDEGGWREALVFEVKSTKPAWADEFRPILSAAEKNREEAITRLQVESQSEHWQAPISASQAINIYDAIAAGKIPGVKLEG